MIANYKLLLFWNSFPKIEVLVKAKDLGAAFVMLFDGFEGNTFEGAKFILGGN